MSQMTSQEMLSEPAFSELRTALCESLPHVLEDILAPVANLEMLKHKEALSEKEVQDLYGISANTLRTKRLRGGGPVFRQGPERGAVLYTHKDILAYLENIKKKP